jgi:hypothetical protein
MINSWGATVLLFLGVLGLSGSVLAFDGNGRMIDAGASPRRVPERCGERTVIDKTPKEAPRFVGWPSCTPQPRGVAMEGEAPYDDLV